MNETAKITLSAKELELVCNKEWILTKQVITEKVYRLFGELAMSMQQQVLQHEQMLPVQVTQSNPKISKGENYRNLPYIILDYPRHFTKEATCAIRTLFWWGNFFSISLQVAGIGKEKIAAAIQLKLDELQQHDYWICINTDPWEHHFEEDNYVSLKNYNAFEIAMVLHQSPFVKLAKKISVNSWNEVPAFLAHHFNEMILLLQINFPGGEKDLLPGIPITGSGL